MLAEMPLDALLKLLLEGVLEMSLQRLRPQQLRARATRRDPGSVAHLDTEPARIVGNHRGNRVEADSVRPVDTNEPVCIEPFEQCRERDVRRSSTGHKRTNFLSTPSLIMPENDLG